MPHGSENRHTNDVDMLIVMVYSAVIVVMMKIVHNNGDCLPRISKVRSACKELFYFFIYISKTILALWTFRH